MPAIISVGSLDRRVTFERKVPQAGFMQAGQQAWAPVATVWAEVQDVLPSRAEQVSAGFTLSNRPTRIRIRYRQDLSADMRILFRDRVMQIVAGPSELGRREGLEFMAEDFSTAGGQP